MDDTLVATSSNVASVESEICESLVGVAGLSDVYAKDLRASSVGMVPEDISAVCVLLKGEEAELWISFWETTSLKLCFAVASVEETEAAANEDAEAISVLVPGKPAPLE